jgi:hypothetical protein
MCGLRPVAQLHVVQSYTSMHTSLGCGLGALSQKAIIRLRVSNRFSLVTLIQPASLA